MSEILGYDIDGQPLRAGDRVEYVGLIRNAKDNGVVATVLGSHEYDGVQFVVTDERPSQGFKAVAVPTKNTRKLPPKQDHEPGSWEEIAKLGWKPEGVEA